MNRTSLTLAVGFALSAYAALGWAKTTDLATVGAWTAFGGTSDDGTQVCGVIESGSEGRSIAIKWFKGDDYLTFQIFKGSWSIKPGARFRVEMEMDTNGPWTARATGSNQHIDFTIPLSKEPQWEREFRDSDQIRISFPDGGEDDWIGNLNGSDTIMTHFSHCIGVISGAIAPRQPYSDGSGPTPEKPEEPDQSPNLQPKVPSSPPGLHRT